MGVPPARPYRDDESQPQSMADNAQVMYDLEGGRGHKKHHSSLCGLDTSTTGPRFRKFVFTMLTILFGIWLVVFVISRFEEVRRAIPS